MGRNREIVVRSFPGGSKMTADDFQLVETEIPAPADGEVLIKNLWLSIEAGQRTHLSSIGDEIDDETIHSAIPMPRPGRTLPGQAVGQVIESRNDRLPAGSFVLGWLGWREYLTSDGVGLQVIDPGVAPPQSYLGTMGMWGAFAYYALLEVAGIKPGESVVVSAAAGAVGMVAVQVAKLHGCSVVGIAGSDEKADWLTGALGADTAINYKGKTAGDLTAALSDAVPGGIDVYFDTVGGPALEAAIDAMKPHGRIIAGGQTASYDGDNVGGPRNYFWITPKRLSVLGCSVVDFLDRYPAYQAQMATWLADGRVIDRQTIYDGIESAPRAWVDLFKGRNLGKMLVQLGEPDPIQ